jgi:hypothetical protein
MAAGLGFKTFTTGEVLTAADVNGYLMQGVLVFASEAARNAAITSPQEGQFAFTKDNNSLWYYTGSAWAASGATGDIEGVTAGVGISGGGTSGTVTITNSMATAIDAKGDLVVGTGADTFSRLAVGTNGHTLVADSAETTGLKWAAPSAGGGWTLLTTTTANNTASTYTYSSLGSYKHICIIGIGLESSTASGASIFFTVNNTGTSYTFAAIENENTAISNNSGLATAQIDTHIVGLGFSGDASNRFGGFKLEFLDYGGSTFKPINYEVYSYGDGNPYYTKGMGAFNSTSAITSIEVKTQVGFKLGTIKVYGVS